MSLNAAKNPAFLPSLRSPWRRSHWQRASARGNTPPNPPGFSPGAGTTLTPLQPPIITSRLQINDRRLD
jgi:hypothetical protein